MDSPPAPGTHPFPLKYKYKYKKYTNGNKSNKYAVWLENHTKNGDGVE